jgi:hypothetical protein
MKAAAAKEGMRMKIYFEHFLGPFKNKGEAPWLRLLVKGKVRAGRGNS